jgi:hypothetical protein
MSAIAKITVRTVMRVFAFIGILLRFHASRIIDKSGLGKNVARVFHSELESDQIIYTRIVIPRNANKILIKIFATTSDDEARLVGNSAANKTESKSSSNTGVLPCALLKYNGLPTFADSDAFFRLPESPMYLQITDDQPHESELYIGLWGGHLLHSFRYFAGSPTVFSTGM